ncbi:TetR/AcrR family transcriptional regulator [Arthrobacter sp. I2-34]|uniref:TetR/AcrR family transcriptional regulator n=1 Tax=Arthrobacter hankyongi TaxID=2904801 RepID=A0ABS9L8H2_9MICC|nr:TetR/AcrR family transcriptional regulator [Arthrobacter hankyongi]MCG2622973.1 TetR/AcrR family transcriptional regulator [Arthrobacter hankyongi]
MGTETKATGAATVGRQQRRREQTRARLIEAAKTLMAERGVESVGISEITDAADLGAGTFYNYFQSRDEIVEAVAEASIESVGAALDRMTADMEDPAEVFASSLRHLVLRATSDPVWGWFIVRMGAAHPTLIAILGPRAARDLRRGVDAGRFTIPNTDIATSCTFGSLISALHLVLSTEPPAETDQLFARTMLAMVGIDAQEAKEIAARPLPALRLEP